MVHLPYGPADARCSRLGARCALTLALLTATLGAQSVEPSPLLPALDQARLVDGRALVYVVLEDQLSPAALERELGRLTGRARRAAVATRLKQHASASQSGLRAWLAARADVTLHHELWMGNALVLSADATTLAELARLPGVAAVRPVRDRAPEQQQDGAGLGLPFADDFDSGTLLPHWEVQVTGQGSAAVSDQNDPIGSHHLEMQSLEDLVDSTASVTVTLDLTGASDVGIRLRHKEFGDEDHDEDGVFVSDDGLTWHKVIDLQGASPEWTAYWVRLDDVLPGLGLTYGPEFRVRFQWRDNFSIPTDGVAFDRIEIGPGVGVEPGPDIEAHLVALGAPQLWEQGYDGSGILIGSIDSGTWASHPDLVDRLWTNPGEVPDNGLDDDANGYIDDTWGWDFENNDPNPQSTDAHGTQSAGLMVGDGSAGKVTGVAPGATLVTCQVGDEVDYWLAQQYLLDVGVDVISSSYSYKWPDRPDYHMFRQLTDLEAAAGIVHANSTGNQGGQLITHPVPFNVSTPGNVPAPFDHPHAADGGRSAVIAVGGINLSDGGHFNPSGRGPSAWEDMTLYDGAWPHPQDSQYWDYPVGGFSGVAPGLVKPDLVAYADSVVTTTIPAGQGNYANFLGTSAATPQIGGALCLLRQVQPKAEPRHLDAALELTAVDLGEPGKDNVFGSGRPRLWHAARRLVVLAQAQPQLVPVGGQLDLALTGQPNTAILGFVGIDLVTGLGNWNLSLPFITLPLFILDGAGELELAFPIPNDSGLIGVTVWTQFGQPLATAEWGLGYFLSVPEAITFGP